jgi:hypothetical protein
MPVETTQKPNGPRAMHHTPTPAFAVAGSTKQFGSLLERPPESNVSLSKRSSIPCGPGNKDRISSFLVYNGFKIGRTERLFSLVRHLCPENDERPIEADAKHVWLGSSIIGNVIAYTETPTLHIWVDWLLKTGYRNGSMEDVEFRLDYLFRSTRVLSALVDAFEIPYDSLAKAIATHRYAKLIGGNEKTWLRFYMERSAHPGTQFCVGS